MQLRRRQSEDRSTGGAALIEFILALPILLMFVLFFIDVGYLQLRYNIVLRALNSAARKLSWVSSWHVGYGGAGGMAFSDLQCLTQAGQAFVAELEHLGVGASEVNMAEPPTDPWSSSEPFVLIGSEIEIQLPVAVTPPPDLYPPPRIFQLSTQLQGACLFCSFFSNLIDMSFEISTLVVMETEDGCYATCAPAEVGAYYYPSNMPLEWRSRCTALSS